MITARALQMPIGLKVANGAFVAFWLLLAIFPLFWILVMSFKIPVDSFATNPLQVIFGFETRRTVGGLSVLDIALGIGVLIAAYLTVSRTIGKVARYLSLGSQAWFGWLLASILYGIGFVLIFGWMLPAVSGLINAVFGALPLLDALTKPVVGLTTEHYRAVWIENAFHQQFLNSAVVTAGVVTVSLTVGTLAGYGLARSGGSLAFWLLVIALVFRALPHSVLVSGYLPPFLNSREWLAPLWESGVTGWFFTLFSDEPPTLFGKHLPVIIVLVSINQPFTIWMLRSFFQNIPQELDEAARVDGCSHFEAFRRVIIPVMWPGVITTGLFSFLLAYNDFLVTSLLLDAEAQTMVPAIAQFFNRETTATDQVEAIAAAVSITAPLFLLVMVFQKQIVSGLTQGAVKG